MNNFISRLVALSLLLSIVTVVSAQDRNIDKSGSKQEVRKDKKSKSADGKGSSRVQGDETASGTSPSGVKNKAKTPGGKLAPGSGNSSRIGNVTTTKQSGKKARKGFLGRLLGRSSKKASKAGGSSAVGSTSNRPAASGSRPVAGDPKEDKEPKKEEQPGETDPRDRP